MVLRAMELVKERRPDLVVDGEMQLDAALLPKVGAPGYLATDRAAAIKGGYANVFIINDELARAMLDSV